MKCTNCGNEDPKTLFDEGDTFYCSICRHRTQVATGQDDLITCPFCGRQRDRKAMHCMWCNNSIGVTPSASKEEYAELDKILTEFENRISSSNLHYGRFLGKKKK